MWIKSENGNSEKPPKTENDGCRVIIRRHYELVPATDEKPEHYEYEEWQMTNSQYEVYQTFEQKVAEQEDALIELAGLITEVIG